MHILRSHTRILLIPITLLAWSASGCSDAHDPGGTDGSETEAADSMDDDTMDPEVRRAEAKALLESEFPPARLAATRTLLELGDPEGLEAVREIVEAMGDDRRSVRMATAAVDMLASVEGSAVDTQLYEYLDHDHDSVNIAAARSLEARGDSNPMSRMVSDMAARLTSDDGGERGIA